MIGIRIFFFLIFAGIVAYMIFLADQRERGEDPDCNSRYTPYLNSLLLPVCLLVLAAGYFFASGQRSDYGRRLFANLFTITLHLSCYQLILFLLLPLFRRIISARACAALWLLPNYLYLALSDWASVDVPRWVISIPPWLPAVAGGIWAAGFAAVLLWKVAGHLQYRRQLLREAQPITEPEILAIFESERSAAGKKVPSYRLVRTPAAKTPLSIGFSRRSIRIVLPQRDYTPEELHLIFRHELVHLGRGDSLNKFFMAFCTALVWFNPLMWVAMSRSADDLELSCDETVLLEEDEDSRKGYARLLLSTAGESQGFTTCLSVSARALRYRLRRASKPQRRLLGSVVVGAMFFLMASTMGYVAMACDCGTGAEVIFGGQGSEAWELTYLRYSGDGENALYSCTDRQALDSYLAALPLEEALYDVHYESAYCVDLHYLTPQGTLALMLVEGYVRVTPLYGERNSTYYRTTEAIDFPYLRSLLEVREQMEEPQEALPTLGLYFNEEINQGGTWIYAKAVVEQTYVDGKAQDTAYPDNGEVCTVTAPEADHVRIYFSHELLTDPYQVKVENWDHTEGDTVSSAVFQKPYEIPLMPYSAHYTIFATVTDRTVDYDMEFSFDVIRPEENP